MKKKYSAYILGALIALTLMLNLGQASDVAFDSSHTRRVAAITDVSHELLIATIDPDTDVGK